MAEAKPAPWSMRATSHGDGSYTLRVGPWSWPESADGPPMFEATLPRHQTGAGGNSVPEDELRARARLMLAAPELLDALSMWVEDPVHCASASDRQAPRPDCDCWACERTRIARAAIAKATTEVRHG